jgi:predicted N-acetyltransferase YhbS
VTQLIVADPGRQEEIMDGTYPIWGEGLSRTAYSAWNRAQLATPWGREHLRRVALVDAGTLVASAKRYDFQATLDGRVILVMGIGAVFTPEHLRGRGHARDLIETMMDDAAARGCSAALLFSEIGPAFYESLGFRVVPRSILTLEVQGRAGSPATFVRSGESTDMAAIAAISARYAGGVRFALDRSADLIAYGFARRRLLAGLGPPGLRHVEFFVAEEGHQVAAYVFLTRGPSGVVLDECGDRDPTGARVGAILQVLAARAPAEPILRMTTSLPPDFRPPQLRVTAETPAPEVMMIRSLEAVSSSIPGLISHVYWQTDLF